MSVNFCVALFILSSAVSPVSAQTTWYVDLLGVPPGTGTQADPYTSLQYAIDQPTTLAGDSLLVAPGTYGESIQYNGKTLLIESSAGAAQTVLVASGLSSVVTLGGGEGAGTALRGFSLRGGGGTNHGGFYRGGGLIVQNAALLIEDCVIEQCSAAEGGAAYLELASVEWRNCTIQDIACGGGICSVSNANLSLENCVLQRIQPTNCGLTGEDLPALYGSSSTIAITNCVFENNQAVASDPNPTRASAVLLEACATTITSSRFERNGISPSFPFDMGGALLAQGGSLTVLDSQFLDNHAETSGGAMTLKGVSLQISQCLFDGNDSVDAFPGGALFFSPTSASTALIESSGFRSNKAGDGGAIYVGSGSVEVVGCEFAQNEALGLYVETGGGGALYCGVGASLNLSLSLLRANLAFGNVFLNPLEGRGGGGQRALDHRSLHAGRQSGLWRIHFRPRRSNLRRISAKLDRARQRPRPIAWRSQR